MPNNKNQKNLAQKSLETENLVPRHFVSEIFLYGFKSTLGPDIEAERGSFLTLEIFPQVCIILSLLYYEKKNLAFYTVQYQLS